MDCSNYYYSLLCQILMAKVFCTAPVAITLAVGWQSVQITRSPWVPTFLKYINTLTTDFKLFLKGVHVTIVVKNQKMKNIIFVFTKKLSKKLISSCLKVEKLYANINFTINRLKRVIKYQFHAISEGVKPETIRLCI